MDNQTTMNFFISERETLRRQEVTQRFITEARQLPGEPGKPGHNARLAQLARAYRHEFNPANPGDAVFWLIQEFRTDTALRNCGII